MSLYGRKTFTDILINLIVNTHHHESPTGGQDRPLTAEHAIRGQATEKMKACEGKRANAFAYKLTPLHFWAQRHHSDGQKQQT